MMHLSLGPDQGMTIQEIDLETVSVTETAVPETTDGRKVSPEKKTNFFSAVMTVATIAVMTEVATDVTTDEMIDAVTIADSSHF